MPNMSYCRFENTVSDLRDCEQALNEISGNIDELSDTERRAAVSIIKICHRIAEDYELDDR